jgi:hypothetical protein
MNFCNTRATGCRTIELRFYTVSLHHDDELYLDVILHNPQPGKNLMKCDESHFPTDLLNKDFTASTHLYCRKTNILQLEFGFLYVSLAP